MSWVDALAGLFQDQVGPTDKSLIMGPITWSGRMKRPPMAIDAGCAIVGAALPIANVDPYTIRAGAMGRVFRQTSPIDFGVLLRFSKFCQRFIEENFDPLPSDTQNDVINWLETESNYPKWRRDILYTAGIRAMDSLSFASNLHGSFVHPWFCINAFQKYENYESMSKLARGIYARADVSKLLFGPLTKRIEKAVMRSKWFIKYVPVSDRGRVMKQVLYQPGARYCCTDFSKFESSFRALIMLVCERALYAHMLQQVSSGEAWISMFDEHVLGRNNIAFSTWNASIIAKRMSGEMFTSLGNGFTNLMLTLFDLSEQGFHYSQIDAFFEGDDGIFRMPDDFEANGRIAKSLGFELKFEVVDAWNKASFCGNLADDEDLVIITDPIKTILSTPWLPPSMAMARKPRLMAALRARALSLYHQYPHAPIIWAYASYLLRVTRGYDISLYINDRSTSMWDREDILRTLHELQLGTSFSNRELPPRPSFRRTRFFVEEVYGIKVEHQYAMERDILRSGFGPLRIPLVVDYAKEDQRLFYTAYSDVFDGNNFNEPYKSWQVDPFIASRPRYIDIFDPSAFNECLTF